ncbi:MAG: ABC transporter substrate-binding protein [Nitrospinota bacterium]|nr:penicillin-binding protein activator [Nitrospinota bacterium]
MKRIFRILLVLLLLPVLFSSAEAAGGRPPPKDQKDVFDSIDRSFTKGAYKDVISQVRIYEGLYPNGEYIEKTSYFNGVSRYHLKDYSGAVDRLKTFMDSYPESSFRYDASLKLALSYYNLNNWAEALAVSRRRLEEDIDPDRVLQFHLVAARSLANMAKFSESLVEYKAAHRVLGYRNRLETEEEIIGLINEKINWLNDLEVAIDIFGDSHIASYAMFKKGKIQFDENNYVAARVSLTQFISNYPDHEYADRARKLIDQTSTEGGATNIDIGAVLPLSGERAEIGRKVMNGLQLAFAEIKPTEDIRLVVKDSQGDPEEAGKLINKMGWDRGVIGIIGPVFSDEAIEGVKAANRHKIPLLSPTAASAELTDISPFFFRNCLMMKNEARFIAETAVRRMDIKRFAILYQNDSQGIALRDYFAARAVEMGGKIVRDVPFDKDESDFSSQMAAIGGISDTDISRLLSEGKKLPDYSYDAVYIAGDAKKTGLILPQLAFFNINDIPIFGSSSTRSEDFIKTAGDSSGGVIFPYSFDPDEKDFLTQDFVKKYQAYFNETPDIIAAQAFDAASILIHLSRSGLTSRGELTKQLSTLKNFRGVSGLTSFNNSGDADKTFYLMKRRAGKFVVLTADDLKELADKHTF